MIHRLATTSTPIAQDTKHKGGCLTVGRLRHRPSSSRLLLYALRRGSLSSNFRSASTSGPILCRSAHSGPSVRWSVPANAHLTAFSKLSSPSTIARHASPGVGEEDRTEAHDCM